MDMTIPFDAVHAKPARKAGPNEQRDQTICMRYREGETLRRIGASFDLTAERVRKIVKRFGLDKNNAGLAVRNRDKPVRPVVQPYSARVYGCSRVELALFTHEQRQAFLQQRTNVKRADTAWLLSLPQWVECWTRSGKWAERGQGPSRYGLSRIDPAGYFSADNVRVATNYESAMRGRNRKSAANRRDKRAKVRNNDWIREMARILEKPSSPKSRRTSAAR